LGPFHAIEGDDSGLPLLADGAAELMAGLKADPRRLIAGLQHHGHSPRRNIRERFDVGKFHAPIACYVELAERTAPALRLVVIDDAGGHGLARHHLDLWIERGSDREAAFVKLLLAVPLENIAANFLGEIFAGKDMSGIGPAGD